MNDNTPIDTIHTSCKNCVFATYDNNTQNDCALNYIDKYKNKNITVLEAYDDEKEFYIINRKKCIGYRENKWFNQFNLDEANISDKIQKYLETNILDYLLIIDLKLETMDIEYLDSILKQISICEIQPKKVIIVRYANNDLKFPYSAIESLFKKYNVPYVWRIQTILELSMSQQDILHNILLTNRNRFALVVNQQTDDLVNVINCTNKIVHHDLDQFEVISNKDRSCIIFSTALYRFEVFHGNDLFKNPDSYTIV